jgi:hypothetical protein
MRSVKGTIVHLRPTTIGLLLAIGMIGGGGIARADEPRLPPGGGPTATPKTDADLAQKFFVEGRVFVERGEYAEACARFEASRKLAPEAIGTLLNLGICNDRLSKFATAITFFRSVLEHGDGGRTDRLELAKGRLAELQPLLSHIRVAVPPRSRVDGLVVKLDGHELAPSAWDIDLEADGGEHTIEASAPDREPSIQKATVDPQRGRTVVTVPMLERPTDHRPLAYVVGGVGAAAFAAGIGVGISLVARCGGLFVDTCKAVDEAPTGEHADKFRSLRTQAWVSTALLAAGAVGVGVGTIILFKAKRPASNAASAPAWSVGLQPTAPGVDVRARF